jgi:hypothetical protein
MIHLWDKNESLNKFQIDISGQRQIETNKETDRHLWSETASQRSKESQMEIDIETMPSPSSTVQRETNIIPSDAVAPIDIIQRPKGKSVMTPSGSIRSSMQLIEVSRNKKRDL